MLIETIKEKIKVAVKEKRELERNILKVLLGEIQTLESRKGNISDEDCIKIARKLIESNQETIKAYSATDEAYNKEHNTDENIAVQKLSQEITIVDSLLPKVWDEKEIANFIRNTPELFQNMIDAASVGQATGIVMKALKTANAPVDGKMVSKVVQYKLSMCKAK